MATNRTFIMYVAEQAALGARLTHRKMFGEYALYLDGKVVALACDNSLFIKPTVAAANLASTVPRRPPYPGAKAYPVIDELLDDPDALQQLLLETAKELPPPKAKPKKAALENPPRKA